MDQDTFERGLATRKAVLGAEYVERALANADAFSQPLQELVTGFAWGTVWQRPGLELRERSMLTLVMLVALNRPHELKLHLRGALNNGLTREEVAEVLLQVGIYGGIPAAVDSFNIATDTFNEIDAENAG